MTQYSCESRIQLTIKQYSRISEINIFTCLKQSYKKPTNTFMCYVFTVFPNLRHNSRNSCFLYYTIDILALSVKYIFGTHASLVILSLCLFQQYIPHITEEAYLTKFMSCIQLRSRAFGSNSSFVSKSLWTERRFSL